MNEVSLGNGRRILGNGQRIPCEECPLRITPHFRPFEPSELEFVSSFKTGELVAEAGAGILSEGTNNAALYTVLSGWAFRYKTLEDGRRQVLNYLLPGDLVGLQGPVMGELDHSVEALSNLVLCVFQRNRLHDLFASHPGLGFDVTWLASREERMLDAHLLSLGRRTALERAAYLIAFLYQRALAVGMVSKKSPRIPITQLLVADTLGLSIVHTNKTLRKLSVRGLIVWHGGACEVSDFHGLMKMAGATPDEDRKRPLI
ncbi:Crp/Fnr family transcriptional regulator [Devosia nitrariae]|uniref:Nitrogen fixation regulatory protein n=1 Tax=Devosia nitrariae TaxID=2071872 RepID=A0ABQ5W7H7_9HYPH|nr:Crp/Fnr family transcriptional regulator [Devosia nitrariae]GLQ55739.1 nitrogen fixation regulatory protein [Devosia nitrariae]